MTKKQETPAVRHEEARLDEKPPSFESDMTAAPEAADAGLAAAFAKGVAEGGTLAHHHHDLATGVADADDVRMALTVECNTLTASLAATTDKLSELEAINASLRRQLEAAADDHAQLNRQLRASNDERATNISRFVRERLMPYLLNNKQDLYADCKDALKSVGL